MGPLTRAGRQAVRHAHDRPTAGEARRADSQAGGASHWKRGRHSNRAPEGAAVPWPRRARPFRRSRCPRPLAAVGCTGKMPVLRIGQKILRMLLDGGVFLLYKVLCLTKPRKNGLRGRPGWLAESPLRGCTVIFDGVHLSSGQSGAESRDRAAVRSCDVVASRRPAHLRPAVRPLGPGIRAALGVLTESGEAIARHWSVLTPEAVLDIEAEAANLPCPGAHQSPDARAGSRWRAYRRTGVACALLRRAGRRERRTCRDIRTLSGRAGVPCGATHATRRAGATPPRRSTRLPGDPQ